MTSRSDLTRMIREASGGQGLAKAVAALDEYDRRRAAALDADRETDLGAATAAQRLTPVPLHEHHTAATDWLSDYQEPGGDYRTAMIAEASTWYRGLDPAVRADGQELIDQASGRAHTLASAYGSRHAYAATEFMTVVSYLHSREGASGLPQIQQTTDPNNAPSTTPLPTEVFPTFAPDQDPYNAGIEGFNHDSQVSSQQAPLIQTVMQQDAGGSGYGTGPERPDSHTTGFDTADSYAEVPLGAPGQIPAQSVQQGGTSTPNPVAGVPQDAGAEQRRTAAVEGWSMPDPFGYRWMMTAEVVHPFHERCAAAHWPDEACGDRSHTASVAVGYATDIDQARRTAGCEALGVRQGLRAVTSSHSQAELSAAHNRVAAGWGQSGRTAEDTAVLHGFMAVIRPVLAELEHEASMTCTACKGGDCGDCTDGDCACAKHPKGRSRTASASGRAKVSGFIDAMAGEFSAPAAG